MYIEFITLHIKNNFLKCLNTVFNLSLVNISFFTLYSILKRCHTFSYSHILWSTFSENMICIFHIRQHLMDQQSKCHVNARHEIFSIVEPPTYYGSMESMYYIYTSHRWLNYFIYIFIHIVLFLLDIFCRKKT